MVRSSTQVLCDQLGRIAAFLEGGDGEAAAGVMVEVQELLPHLPSSMPDDELAQAQQLLQRCCELEAGLRQRIVASLKELGAGRRGFVYRHMASRR